MLKFQFKSQSLNMLILWLKSLALDDKKYTCEIKVYNEKRSLSANSYYWALLEKISKAVGVSKDELHEEMLSSYGTLLTDADGDIMCFKSSKEVNKVATGIHCRLYAQLDGEYIYQIVKGSHVYDSKEMHELIEGIVQEAKNLEIETMTPRELDLLRYE